MKEIKDHTDEPLNKLSNENRQLFDAIIDQYEIQLPQRDEEIKDLEPDEEKHGRMCIKQPSRDGTKKRTVGLLLGVLRKSGAMSRRDGTTRNWWEQDNKPIPCQRISQQVNASNKLIRVFKERK